MAAGSTEGLRKIRVYGRLSTFLKRRVFRAAVKDAAEAVRFLLVNFPGLQKHMADQFYEVRVSNRPLMIGDDPTELHLPTGATEEISIVPVIAGAGSGAAKVLAGIGLVAAAIFLGPVAGGFLGLGTGFTAGATAGAIATAVGTLGASLIIGGVAQLLTPSPTLQQQQKIGKDSDSDPSKSYAFSGIQNVSRQGVPVNVVYGETIVGSIVISAGISTERVY